MKEIITGLFFTRIAELSKLDNIRKAKIIVPRAKVNSKYQAIVLCVDNAFALNWEDHFSLAMRSSEISPNAIPLIKLS
jgi:hypothetical protein